MGGFNSNNSKFNLYFKDHLMILLRKNYFKVYRNVRLMLGPLKKREFKQSVTFLSDAPQPEVSFFLLCALTLPYQRWFDRNLVQNHGSRVQEAHFRLTSVVFRSGNAVREKNVYFLQGLRKFRGFHFELRKIWKKSQKKNFKGTIKSHIQPFHCAFIVF